MLDLIKIAYFRVTYLWIHTQCQVFCKLDEVLRGYVYACILFTGVRSEISVSAQW